MKPQSHASYYSSQDESPPGKQHHGAYLVPAEQRGFAAAWCAEIEARVVHPQRHAPTLTHSPHIDYCHCKESRGKSEQKKQRNDELATMRAWINHQKQKPEDGHKAECNKQ
ncbi:hypothetical protein GCM10010411_77650 [Actinomadura fulvescens]|uniref:Uncharacterized protein n=1 Tax=Actinomadura fulvescens TaxID=46160 RepID=A0ABN3QKS4_9ACTN